MPTITGQILGSPNYMPPEQASGTRGAVGTWSDVYSLGAILYHLLTGRPPFQSCSLEETLLQLLHTEPVPPRALSPSVPRDLETICLTCLHKEPARRYPSALALAEDLGRWRAGEPIQARPASAPERFWRWCRRQPALAAIILLLGAVAAGSTWAAVRFHRIGEAARLSAYVAEVNAALHNWGENNPEQALSLLRQHRPRGGEADLRGFEWRYLWRLCRGAHQLLPQHNQVVDAMQFSPDGRLLATYCWDTTLRLWDLETRQKLLELPAASALGSFSPDGQLFTIGMKNGSILRRRVPTGATTPASTNAGEMLACAADGKTVLTIDRVGRLQVRDVDTRQVRFSPPLTVRRYLDYGWGSPAALSPDGRTLAVVQLSQNLKRLDPGIKLWDVSSGAELPFLSENRSIRCFKFSPDGRTLAVGDGLGTVKLWNLATRDFKPISASDLPVLSLAFSPDGQTLATGSSGQIIKLWATTTGAQEPKTFRGPIGQVWSLAFSPDGKRLASGGRNSPVRIWNLDETETPDEAHGLHTDKWGNFTFSLDSQRMAAGTKNHTVKVWDVDTFALTAELPGASFAVAFTRDGTHLLTSGLDESPQWWDLVARTNQPIPRYAGSMGSVSSVDLSPDRRTAALGHKDGTIQFLEISSGRDLGAWKGHADEVRSVAFSPRGDKLVSGGRDRSVAVWDVATRQKLGASGEHRGAVCTVAFSHDGKRMASGCGAGTIKLWDPAQVNRRSLASISYHQDAIRTLAFSPDGRTLASGSGDGMVKLWNVALQKEAASFKHDGPVRLVVFSPNGNTLATVTDRGTLRLFRAATLQEADAAETP